MLYVNRLRVSTCVETLSLHKTGEGVVKNF